MTEKELMAYAPHPKKCMADKFDSKPGVQCDNLRSEEDDLPVWWGNAYDIELPSGVQTVHVKMCDAHRTYRRNGGRFMGPYVLRAAAEVIQQFKRSAPRRPARRQNKE